MPSNPPYDDDWSGESRNLQTGEVRFPAAKAAKSEDGELPPLETCPPELRHGYPECDCDLEGGDSDCRKTPTNAEICEIYSPLKQRERQLRAALSRAGGESAEDAWKRGQMHMRGKCSAHFDVRSADIGISPYVASKVGGEGI